eukprot:9434241-Heterocapsa_arctica.AAC.1
MKSQRASRCRGRKRRGRRDIEMCKLYASLDDHRAMSPPHYVQKVQTVPALTPWPDLGSCTSHASG